MSNKQKLTAPILPPAVKHKPLWKYGPIEAIIDPEEAVALLATTLRNPRWQRAGGPGRGGGWDIQQGKAFIVNWIHGDSDTDIINVDLAPALSYAKQVGDTQSIDYYTVCLAEGYTEANIDAHHQLSFIVQFMTNKIAVDVMSNGVELFYEDLHEDDQKNLLQKCLRYRKLQKCLYSGAEKIFKIKNNAVATNEWQKFMSAKTPVIDWLYDRTEPAQSTPQGQVDRGQWYSFWHLGFTPHICDKESHTEVLCKLAMSIGKNFPKDLNLRKSYTIPYFESLNTITLDTQTKVDSVLKEMAKESNDLFALARAKVKGTTKKATLGNALTKSGDKLIWGLVQYVKLAAGFETTPTKDVNVQSNGRLFFDWWRVTHQAMLKASGEVKDKDRESQSYAYWVQMINTGEFLQKVISVWVNAFNKYKDDLEARGIIKPLPKKRQGSFSIEQKIQSLINNEMMDIEGEPRSVSDFLLGNIVGGHAISDANGGPNDDGNVVPETSEGNQAHGKENINPEKLKDLPISKHLNPEIFEPEEEPVNRNEKVV